MQVWGTWEVLWEVLKWQLDGMKIIAILRQYCEKNVLVKEKKEYDLNEHRTK